MLTTVVRGRLTTVACGCWIRAQCSESTKPLLKFRRGVGFTLKTRAPVRFHFDRIRTDANSDLTKTGFWDGFDIWKFLKPKSLWHCSFKHSERGRIRVSTEIIYLLTLEIEILITSDNFDHEFRQKLILVGILGRIWIQNRIQSKNFWIMIRSYRIWISQKHCGAASFLRSSG
jgi:hypothetical protein